MVILGIFHWECQLPTGQASNSTYTSLLGTVSDTQNIKELIKLSIGNMYIYRNSIPQMRWRLFVDVEKVQNIQWRNLSDFKFQKVHALHRRMLAYVHLSFHLNEIFSHFVLTHFCSNHLHPTSGLILSFCAKTFFEYLKNFAVRSQKHKEFFPVCLFVHYVIVFCSLLHSCSLPFPIFLRGHIGMDLMY